ncbi:TetR/AcrR family transcriptional regulator [Stenotrophomonas pavanii]|uniref:TetR/AcrR family transcriptional regulator n=1 Tax=Stenotrophomonas pavanii TaxID=487698 RepID=UPI001313C438
MARIRNDKLHEERRAQILEAAASVFREKGFHAARTEDICSQAEMSAGAVFRYFKDKREMIDAIVSREISSYANDAKALVSREGLEWLARANSEELKERWRESDNGLGLDAWMELVRDPDRHREMVELDVATRKELASTLQSGIAEGWARPGIDPQSMASLIVTVTNGLWLEQSLKKTADLEQSVKAVRDFLRDHVLKT